MTALELAQLLDMAAVMRAQGLETWPTLIERAVAELRGLRDSRVDEVSMDVYRQWMGPNAAP